MDVDILHHLPVSLEAIATVRRTVGQAAKAAGMGSDRIDDLLVAVSEAMTNAIEAQLSSGVTEPLEVHHDVDRRVFEVRIRDRGAGFAPHSIPDRPPAGDEHHLDVERGWGIQLMRELVDDLVFDITQGGTTVHLRMAI